jgi:hypothetical protein
MGNNIDRKTPVYEIRKKEIPLANIKRYETLKNNKMLK